MKDYSQVLVSNLVFKMSKRLGMDSRKRKAKNLHHMRLTQQVDMTSTSSPRSSQMMSLTLKWISLEILQRLFLESFYRDPISEQWPQSKRAKIGKGSRNNAVEDAFAQFGHYRTVISFTYERMTMLNGKINSSLRNSLTYISTFAASLYSDYFHFTTID